MNYGTSTPRCEVFQVCARYSPGRDLVGGTVAAREGRVPRLADHPFFFDAPAVMRQ